MDENETDIFKLWLVGCEVHLTKGIDSVTLKKMQSIRITPKLPHHLKAYHETYMRNKEAIRLDPSRSGNLYSNVLHSLLQTAIAGDEADHEHIAVDSSALAGTSGAGDGDSLFVSPPQAAGAHTEPVEAQARKRRGRQR